MKYGLIVLFAAGIVACSQQQDKGGTATPAPSENLLQYLVVGGSDHPKDNPKGQDASLPLVKVEITPEHPTSSDSIKAIITPVNSVPADDYLYEWRVDDRIIESANGPLLSNTFYKKHNLVKVNVFALIGEKKVLCGESSIVIIGNSVPTLEMNLLTARTKDFADIQLIGNDADGDKLIYALEPPVPDGMTLDASSGKVRWRVPRGFRGVLQFRASVTDTDGAKITKTFEVTASDKQ